MTRGRATGAASRGRAGARSASRPSLLHAAAVTARALDRALTAVAGVILVLALLYSGYALWDTWRIYEGAAVDESLLKYKPSPNTAGGNNFAELLAINPDVCAWLTVDGTSIDYPVVRGEDNVAYVNTDVYGRFSLSGSIFLDCRNTADFSDAYSLIYGHHMEGNVMFGELARFSEASYFEEHPLGTLLLPDGTYDIEFFACLQVDAYDAQIFGPGKLTEGEVTALLERACSEALQYRDIGVSGKDKVLALSTCSDAATNARTIVLGRLVETVADEGGTQDDD